MAKKKTKLATPEWILEGYDSEEEYEKTKGIDKKKTSGKTFKIRKCPKCSSDDVGIVLSNSDAEEGGGKEWECRKCKWKGANIKEEELSEEEFLKYLDEKGEPVD
ncbi:MAG: hypothetical protein OQK82_05940 [Candidatus Pacearchaeota archaeon]|nr:hypothetical protein [Candidatus Pacearchaeota archaeon]